MEEKKCESCGMPIKTDSDHGASNPDNLYCKFCTNQEGVLKPYEEKVSDFQSLLLKTNDISEEEAILMAKDILKDFPAWKDK